MPSVPVINALLQNSTGDAVAARTHHSIPLLQQWATKLANAGKVTVPYGHLSFLRR